MPDQRLQGNDRAPAMFLRIGRHQYRWSPEMTDSDALAVVPQGVVENLAALLEKVRPIIGSDELHGEVERALTGYRAAYPSLQDSAISAAYPSLQDSAISAAHPREETT